MKWYRKLYLGEHAKEAKYKVFGRIRKGRFQMDTFLITLSDHPDNLLDIFSSNVLNQPYYKKKRVNQDIYVVGLAKGYDEALEVVRVIVDDVYSHTGTFDLRSYLRFGQTKKR